MIRDKMAIVVLNEYEVNLYNYYQLVVVNWLDCFLPHLYVYLSICDILHFILPYFYVFFFSLVVWHWVRMSAQIWYVSSALFVPPYASNRISALLLWLSSHRKLRWLRAVLWGYKSAIILCVKTLNTMAFLWVSRSYKHVCIAAAQN